MCHGRPIIAQRHLRWKTSSCTSGVWFSMKEAAPQHTFEVRISRHNVLLVRVPAPPKWLPMRRMRWMWWRHIGFSRREFCYVSNAGRLNWVTRSEHDGVLQLLTLSIWCRSSAVLVENELIARCRPLGPTVVKLQRTVGWIRSTYVLSSVHCLWLVGEGG